MTNRSDAKVVGFCSFVALAIFVLDSFIPAGVAVGVLYILVVFISLWAHNKKWPIYMAVASTVLVAIGFLISPAGGEIWKTMLNRLISIVAIWSVTFLSIQRRILHEEKEYALQQVKILSGFLPICSSCKKIRDDKGYWNQIESYIREHSEAEFSHGICPDCAEKLYPELNLYKKNST